MGQNELTKSIISSKQEAFWVYDLQTQQIEVSPAWRKIFDLPADAPVTLDFFSKLVGKNELTLEKIVSEYHSGRAGHAHVFVFPKNKHEHLWIEDIAFGMQLCGCEMGVNLVIGHTRDITKIHLRRHRNDLIDNMGKDLDVCLWEMHLNAKKMHLDFPGVESLTRIITIDEQTKLLHPDDRIHFVDSIELCQKGKDDFFFEGRVATMPGSDKWKWIRALGRCHQSEGERLISGFSYVINQERENDFKIAALNQELNRSKYEIQKTYQEQQQFIEDVTTEMRAPLDMMLSGIQLLEDRLQDQGHGGIFASLKGAGFGILKMVQGLSEVIKLHSVEHGKGNDRFDMKKILANTTDLVNLGLNQSDKTGFSYSFSSQPPLMVFGHLERTKKLFSHLAAMLLEEVKNGLITVKVDIEREVKTEVLVVTYSLPIQVNNSKGFDAQQFFEEYLEKGNFQALEGKSFDFGMTVLRKYAELAGVSIAVHQYQQEKVYKLVFPYRPDLSAETVQTSERLRVLVVDDIELNRELMGMYLEDIDCEVLEAESGVEAVALFQKYHFGLVLMDLQMPQMTGYDAVIMMRQIEESMQRTKSTIIAISAYAIADEVEKCIQLGFDNALDKPVAKEKILSLANEAIALQKV